jgi:pyruvate-ferredoxin/flavodoxin oxidoreductase
MTTAMSDQKAAVDSGQWLLYRYNPERGEQGENPLLLDSRTPTRKVQDYMLMETRFKMLTKSKPEDANQLWQQAQHDADVRYRFYEYMAQRKFGKEPPKPPQGAPEKRASSQEVSKEKPTTVGAAK